MEVLHEFFAVTITSVYRVTDQKEEHDWPIVEKIELKGQSKIPVGGRLLNGHFIGITPDRIFLYDEDHPRSDGKRLDPLRVNTAFWGGGTSPIVALFLNKEEAISCLKADNLRQCDARWRKQTGETLKVIGKEHPTFILSEYEPMVSE